MNSRPVNESICLGCSRRIKVYLRGNRYKGPVEALLYNHNGTDGRRCPMSGFPGEPVMT